MNQEITRNLSLFDLLARNWHLPAPVEAVRFAADGSAAAFSCADGTVSIARTADREPPEDRIRVSADLGQVTIRPRAAAPAPLVVTGSLHAGAPPITAGARGDFLVGASDGVHRIALADGTERTDMDCGGPVMALDHDAVSGLTAVSDGREIVLADSRGGRVRLPGQGEGDVRALSFSPAGRRLAVVKESLLEIWSVEGEPSLAAAFDLPAGVLGAAWNGDGAWLACPIEAGGFVLIDLATGRTSTIGDFPAGTRDVSWSGPANALMASGAFRIAGWSMETPPIDGSAHGALVTGRAGLVIVGAVAAHPGRPLVAAGYANGQVVVARIGARDELLVRPAGGAVTAFAWSPDGRHLAAGTADGEASLITFPIQLFK